MPDGICVFVVQFGACCSLPRFTAETVVMRATPAIM